MTYRNKQYTFEAVLWDGPTTYEAVAAFLDGHDPLFSNPHDKGGTVRITVYDGTTEVVEAGWWIARLANGKLHRLCHDQIFRDLYEPVPGDTEAEKSHG